MSPFGPPAGDLGAIDAKYDVAASTACPSLDYIVVDTTSAAQRCVELLRQRQLGVATFLILEKQQHLAQAMQAKAPPPEGGCTGGSGLSRAARSSPSVLGLKALPFGMWRSSCLAWQLGRAGCGWASIKCSLDMGNGGEVMCLPACSTR